MAQLSIGIVLTSIAAASKRQARAQLGRRNTAQRGHRTDQLGYGTEMRCSARAWSRRSLLRQKHSIESQGRSKALGTNAVAKHSTEFQREGTVPKRKGQIEAVQRTGKANRVAASQVKTRSKQGVTRHWQSKLSHGLAWRQTRVFNIRAKDFNMKEMKVRITFLEPVLGTRPADPELHSHFIASKAPDHKTMAEEIADFGTQEVEERGKTIFMKLEDGTPYLYTYMLSGYFKETAKALKKVPGSKTSKVTAYLKKIDNNIFVRGHLPGKPRVMPLYMPIDLDLNATDNQRPLRASTPQGERVALAHSEEAPAGSYFECTIYCEIDSDVKLVEEWLDRGQWKGIGQWRNAGYGMFTWERI